MSLVAEASISAEQRSIRHRGISGLETGGFIRSLVTVNGYSSPSIDVLRKVQSITRRQVYQACARES